MPAVIDYQSPQRDAPRPPSPLVATLLCVPGTTCWCGLVVLVLARIGLPMSRGFIRLLAPALLLTWVIAVLTAMFSLWLYARGPRPWYVWLNLVINVAGLLFTAGVVLLIMAIWAQ